MAVKNNIPSQLHNMVYGTITIVPADTTTYKTLLTITGGDNSKETHLFSIGITSDDTVNRDLLFAINDGTTDIQAGLITVPALSGDTVALPPISGLANRFAPIFTRCLKDAKGNWFVPLYPGEVLKVKSLVTVTAAKTIRITTVGWNFTRS